MVSSATLMGSAAGSAQPADHGFVHFMVLEYFEAEPPIKPRRGWIALVHGELDGFARVMGRRDQVTDDGGSDPGPARFRPKDDVDETPMRVGFVEIEAADVLTGLLDDQPFAMGIDLPEVTVLSEMLLLEE